MNFTGITVLACAVVIVSKLVFADAVYAGDRIRPGHPEWPMAWTSYKTVKSLEEDIEDLKAHGVGLISSNARNRNDKLFGG